MNAIEMAEVLDKKYTLPLAHEAAAMLRKQQAGIDLALKYLQRGNDIDVLRAVEVLTGAL